MGRSKAAVLSRRLELRDGVPLLTAPIHGNGHLAHQDNARATIMGKSVGRQGQGTDRLRAVSG